MMKSSLILKVATNCLIVVTIMFPTLSQAVTISSGPTFAPATKAPLAGNLLLTTDVNSRVSVTVSDGTDTWERDFYTFSTIHSIPLLGFKPDRTNQIAVTVYDEVLNSFTSPEPMTFVTAPLPTNFPNSVVLQSQPSLMEPGYTLFIIMNHTANQYYIDIVDNTGAVVWYAPWTNNDVDVRQLENGDLFIEEQAPLNDFLELDMLGNVVQVWTAPSGYPVNIHDGVPTDHGTILYLSDQTVSVPNFPVNDTNSIAALTTARVADERVVEISATNAALLNAWSPVDMLDPTRITYLTYGEYSGSPFGVDNEHGNAVLEDTNDNTIIESLRDQNAVFDFTPQGQLKWILAPPEGWSANIQPYLLNPIGTPFEWSYGQHAPLLTPQGTLLLFDDGSYRASPYDPPVADQENYSRGVEYSIDETNMEISQVWDTTAAAEDQFYSAIMGKAQWLPQTQHVLVTYSYITYLNGQPPSPYAPNATMARIIEYTHDPVPNVVFDLSFFDYDNTNANYLGYAAYRSERIADLYPHPAAPVAYLIVSVQNQTPTLEFSADPVRTYFVQASTDLEHWSAIGAPEESEVEGDFSFQDLDGNAFSSRYYRVITK